MIGQEHNQEECAADAAGELLLLCHRIPFPPNKGDKIRSFNLLRFLSRHFRVHLGAFVDDPEDSVHADRLSDYCADVHLVGIDPRWRKLRSLSALVTGEALSLPFYRHSRMVRWVDGKLADPGIRYAIAYSSPMAQYLRDANHLVRVVDFVDVDSEKWRQYADEHSGPMSWLYAREGKRLLAFDRQAAAAADASVFVSPEEADLFRRLAPEVASSVHPVRNGVDTEYFSPQRTYRDPYDGDRHVLAFTGAMDYWANEDAVTWFAAEVFPRIRRSVADARFFIVGARPTRAVKALGEYPGVHVTGAVDDVRPYVAHAAAAVAPLRVARGVQNKVLEAMAMARPVIATRDALDGIGVKPPLLDLQSDDPETLARLACTLITDGDSLGYGVEGRRMVEAQFSWDHHLERFLGLLDGHSRGPAQMTATSVRREPDAPEMKESLG